MNTQRVYPKNTYMYAGLKVNFDPIKAVSGLGRVSTVDLAEFGEGCIGVMPVFATRNQAEAWAGYNKSLEIKTA